jgi:hypothetical protein
MGDVAPDDAVEDDRVLPPMLVPQPSIRIRSASLVSAATRQALERMTGSAPALSAISRMAASFAASATEPSAPDASSGSSARSAAKMSSRDRSVDSCAWAATNPAIMAADSIHRDLIFILVVSVVRDRSSRNARDRTPPAPAR